MSDRMEECVCANGALVASVVHPYCGAHAHPDVEADAERWRYVRKCFEDPTAKPQDVLDAVALSMPRKARPMPVDRQKEHIEQFFAYGHLPPHLQAVSKPFGDLAEQLVTTLPRNPERTVALRKLLEAKDAAVRALIAKDVNEGVCSKCGRAMVFSTFRNAWECSPCREPTPAIAHSGNA